MWKSFSAYHGVFDFVEGAAQPCLCGLPLLLLLMLLPCHSSEQQFIDTRKQIYYLPN
jgi:hypothetical protein